MRCYQTGGPDHQSRRVLCFAANAAEKELRLAAVRAARIPRRRADRRPVVECRRVRPGRSGRSSMGAAVARSP